MLPDRVHSENVVGFQKEVAISSADLNPNGIENRRKGGQIQA
jgi:hypothetical protein